MEHPFTLEARKALYRHGTEIGQYPLYLNIAADMCAKCDKETDEDKIKKICTLTLATYGGTVASKEKSKAPGRKQVSATAGSKKKAGKGKPDKGQRRAVPGVRKRT